MNSGAIAIPPLFESKITLNGIPSGLIYHYTNSEAFRKIISSGVLLLSDYRDAKDSSELAWAHDFYIKTISPLFPSSFNFSILPNRYYIFCTCLRQNNKYLWQNYASNIPGDCTGVVIGLNANSFYKYYSIDCKLISMAAMDYDVDSFKKTCKQSIEGLKPISITKPLWPLSTSNVADLRDQERIAFLNSVPGYKEFSEKRQAVFDIISLQKKNKYSREEEVRVVHWQNPHEALQETIILGKPKAILPWRLKKGHFIKEIFLSEKSDISENEIRNLLVSQNIEVDIKTLQLSALI